VVNLAFEPEHRNDVKKPQEHKKKKGQEQPQEEPKKQEPESKELKFPIEVFVNKYGFLRLNAAIMSKFLGRKVEYSKKGHDVGKDIELTLDIVAGQLVIKRKSA
jgi:hypothetical protein